MSPAESLARVCRQLGARVPLWTQGPGSNVSLKAGGALYVKASGARLDAVRADAGVAAVDLPRAVAALGALRESDPGAEQGYAEALEASTLPGCVGRPSMETGFHLVLPRSWVVHLHAVTALLMSWERSRRPAEFDAWLRGATPLALGFLPAARPGFLLARQLERAPAADVYVLANHGLVLQDDAAPDAEGSRLSQWSALERAFCRRHGYLELEAQLGGAPAGPDDAPAPYLAYFPDTAVFRDRIEAVLLPVGEQGAAPLFRLAPDAFARDRDAAEIWVAGQRLFRWCPSLPELPAQIRGAVPSLPTELYRRGERR